MLYRILQQSKKEENLLRIYETVDGKLVESDKTVRSSPLIDSSLNHLVSYNLDKSLRKFASKKITQGYESSKFVYFANSYIQAHTSSLFRERFQVIRSRPWRSGCPEAIRCADARTSLSSHFTTSHEHVIVINSIRSSVLTIILLETYSSMLNCRHVGRSLATAAIASIDIYNVSLLVGCICFRGC